MLVSGSVGKYPGVVVDTDWLTPAVQSSKQSANGVGSGFVGVRFLNGFWTVLARFCNGFAGGSVLDRFRGCFLRGFGTQEGFGGLREVF